jgi:hypothetical protein
MKPAKPALLAISIIILALFLPFHISQTYTKALVASDLETNAITFVNYLKDGQFESATELFNAEMVESLPPETLESTWNDLISAVGNFEEIVEIRTTEERGYQVVYVTCNFAQALIDIRIIFDEETQITGLWFAQSIEGIHGIYIAALLVTGASVVLWGGLLYWLSKRQWKYLALIFVTLPFSFIVNLLIKASILDFAVSSAGVYSQLSTAWPFWLLVFVLFLSPITEEAIKLTPLVAKQARKLVRSSSALWVGMALGIGFGMGEIWYLAWQFSMVPQFAGYPFYYFTGFIGERLIVVFLHGVMTAIAVVGFLKGSKGLLLGYLGAILLHALTNVGALLFQIQVIDEVFASIYLLVPILASLLIFERLRRRQLRDEKPKEPIPYTRNEGS